MSVTNQMITRSNVNALIPEQTSNAMLVSLNGQSAALQLFRRLPLATNQMRFPVLSALPVAYFVEGDTGLKQTSTVAWSNKYINVEELAVIIPIPEAVLDDSGFDVWGSIQPLMEEAICRTLDAAIFFGTGKPASWPTAIVPAAIAAGNHYTRGTSAASIGGLAEDLNQVVGVLEDDGYDANGIVATRSMRSKFRGARATDGQALMDINGNVDSVWGLPIVYPMRGQWAKGSQVPEAIVGDWSQQIMGVRKDMTYKILDQAVIQDADGNIVFNLAQQDMVAMRLVFRPGWATANPINRDEPDEADRYPAAILRAPNS